ncbi:IS66 family insertion sequence element accessory protein TnpB, partial [Escherichia coli]
MDGRDCCQTGQPSQDVTDGALTNGLASKVQNTLKDDPFSGHIFVFRGRSGKMVKILWADRDGLC